MFWSSKKRSNSKIILISTVMWLVLKHSFYSGYISPPKTHYEVDSISTNLINNNKNWKFKVLWLFYIYLFILFIYYYYYFFLFSLLLFFLVNCTIQSGNCTYPVFAKSNTWTWGSSFNSGLNATSLILWNIDKHSWLHLDFSVSL